MTTPSQSRSQAQDAYAYLRRAVLACEFAPGAKILVGEICERLGVSSGSVREALSRLTAEDLVVAEPQRGFRAAPISVDDLIDLTRARSKVEALCLTESIARGDLAWESGVLAAHHRLANTAMYEASAGRRLSQAWSRVHRDFHEALAAGCDSRWLLRVRAMLYEQSERYRHMSVPFDEAGRDVAAEHKAIFDAAMARDAATAERLIREHIETTTRIIADGVAAMGGRAAL
jgi:DNA-binding GntR family transcriptional regulator